MLPYRQPARGAAARFASLNFGKLRKEPDYMKAASRLLSVFLVLALTLSCSACASGTDTAAGKEEAGQEGTGEELSAEADSTTGLF